MEGDISSIQVVGVEEGELLIEYLSGREVWITPFVIETEGGGYYVKAVIPMVELEAALTYVREEW